MKIRKFIIKNFRGISEATINLSRNDGCRVHAFIGLNESGKTTILEALNLFLSAEDDVQSVYSSDLIKPQYHDFIPKKLKGNFTGRIDIEAHIELEPDDYLAISKYFDGNEDYKLIKVVPWSSQMIKVIRAIHYKDSIFVESNRLWSVGFKCVNRKGRKKETEFWGKEGPWLGAVNALGKRLPRISYFPTFLFDLPERIYLEAYEKEPERSVYYRRLIQDVLDSLGRDYDLGRHVVDRIRPADIPFDWFGYLASERKKTVNAVLLEASNMISEVVFSSWERVFGRSFKEKRVRLEAGYDTEKDKVYLTLALLDGSEEYAISERSLGFRWFFCFLLFTYFRGIQKDHDGVIFLFDEPASNLHARAQEELLSSFSVIAGDKNSIIYSTHSQYLIKPAWLGAAYIIVNGALDYDDVAAEGKRIESDIRAIPYRDFVGQNASGITYLIPVLDALDYKPSPFDVRGPAVLVEGRFDFSFLRLCRPAAVSIDIIPGRSADSLNPIVSLMVGWGQPFAILLDDDDDGKQALQRYRSDWSLSTEETGTIGDCHASLKGKSLEGALKTALSDELKAYFNTKSPSKKQLQLYVYEAFAADKREMLNESALEIGDAIWSWITKHF